MGDPDGMQILEEIDHFCDVEESDFFGEFVDVGLDEIDKLSALTVLLHKIEGGLVLEGVAQLDDAGVLEVGEQLPLDHRLVLLLLPFQLPLLDLLQGIHLFLRNGLGFRVRPDSRTRNMSTGALL